MVVIHFYAFGCINCKNNYPVYLDWQETFKDENVAIIGIKTPETKAEHDVGLIQQKAKEAGFTFPILADIEKTIGRHGGTQCGRVSMCLINRVASVNSGQASCDGRVQLATNIFDSRSKSS